MTVPIRVPQIGQAAEDALLVEWNVAPGAIVRAGDVVAIVETDKAEVEVESPAAGTIGPYLAETGARYPLGAVLAEVDTTAEVGTTAKVDTTGVPAAAAGPAVAVPGTRWHGRPVRARRPLDPARAAVARATTETWAAVPHFVQMIDVDLAAASRRRADTGATWTDLVVHALAEVLAADPARNIAYDRGDIIELASVDIGVAVDTPRGLVVPVVRDVDRLDLPSLSARLAELAARARAGALEPDDRRGGSATVSNLGGFGIRAGTPVLHAPQALLVFVGAAEARAVIRAGAVVAALEMTLSIAYDHRAFDGAAAARITAALRAELEAG